MTHRTPPEPAPLPLQVMPIGGMGEIGKNTLVYRYGDEILVVDFGMAFPEQEHHGVDLIVPNLAYLQEHAHLIQGVVITHGHEDHIGGLPFALAQLPRIPVYAAPLAYGLIREKLKEYGFQPADVDLRLIGVEDTLRIGQSFVVDRFRMTHSIPENTGYVLHTPVGVVVHTGDFKLDERPADGMTSNLSKIGAAAKAGVLLLISDSTSAERPGWSPSEADVAAALDPLIRHAPGRVFLTTFASHAHRLQNVIRIAESCGRRVVIEGRSLSKYAQVALETGHLTVREPLLTSDDVAQLQDQQVLYLCTGSQGQPMSVMGRLAFGRHQRLALRRGDTVILSSSPIPGNEGDVNAMINALYELGVQVFDPPNHRVHASGHGSQEELLTVLNLARPKYFLPWHGEPRHQIHHARLAQTSGRPPKRTIVARNGDVITLDADRFEVTGTVPANEVMIDGLGVGDVDADVLVERRDLGVRGLLVVLVQRGHQAQVTVVPRGQPGTPAMLRALKDAALNVVRAADREKLGDDVLLSRVQQAVMSFMEASSGRRPVVIASLVSDAST